MLLVDDGSSIQESTQKVSIPYKPKPRQVINKPTYILLPKNPLCKGKLTKV